MLHNAVFWLAVSMLLFLAVALKPGTKAVLAGLDARRNALKAELEKAKALRAEAEEWLADSIKKQEEATRTAEAIVAEARADAARLAEDAKKKMAETLATREAAALAKIAEAEANATREAKALAADMAIAASREWLKQRLTADGASKLIEQAIAGIKTDKAA